MNSRFLVKQPIRLSLTVTLFFGTAFQIRASSQLAVFFDQVSKAERDPGRQLLLVDAVHLDFNSMNVPEEIPAIVGALKSGDPQLVQKAVEVSSDLLRTHSGTSNPPSPIDAATKAAFQPVIAEAISHFGDPRPLATTFTNGENNGAERLWKLGVIDLVVISGSAPSREMVDWMEQTVSTSSERTSNAVRQISESYAAAGRRLTQADRDSFVREAGEDNQEVFRHIAPALASVRPLGPDELTTLLVLLNEPDTVTKIAVIDQIVINQIRNPSVIRELIAAALNDPDVPVWVRHGMLPFPVRVAAINALGALDAKVALPDLRRIAATEDDDRKSAALAAIRSIEGVNMPGDVHH